MTPASGQWDDLATRLVSGGTIAAVGLGLMWLGGIWFQILCAAAAGIIIWELARMLGGGPTALPLGLLAAIYLSELAPGGARRLLKPLLELLAGVPPLVYGYLALTLERAGRHAAGRRRSTGPGGQTGR